MDYRHGQNSVTFSKTVCCYYELQGDILPEVGKNYGRISPCN